MLYYRIIIPGGIMAEWVGCVVQLTTTENEVFRGVLKSVDPTYGSIALDEGRFGV